MTKNEIRMSNEERNGNDETKKALWIVDCGLNSLV